MDSTNSISFSICVFFLSISHFLIFFLQWICCCFHLVLSFMIMNTFDVSNITRLRLFESYDERWVCASNSFNFLLFIHYNRKRLMRNKFHIFTFILSKTINWKLFCEYCCVCMLKFASWTYIYFELFQFFLMQNGCSLFRNEESCTNRMEW